MINKLVFEVSPAYILLCVIAGLLYAVLLYNRRNPWTKKISMFLGILRFILVFVLAFLLLGLLLRRVRNTEIKPTAVISVDNSSSINLVHDSLTIQEILQNTNQLKEYLEETGFDVEVRSLSESDVEITESIKFDHPKSDLSELFHSIRSDYENRNLSLMVLISDGIYNIGTSPAFNMPNVPIYTIGLGDTTRRKDIVLNQVFHNKISYQGNKFPVVAEIHNYGYNGDSVIVEVIKSNQVLKSDYVKFSNDNGLSEVRLDIEAQDSGLQHYVVRTGALPGEFNSENNFGHVYIDIVEGREKILLLAGAPHPDIKALKTSIEKNENYEVILCIAGIHTYKEGSYDLAIMYQLPDRKRSHQRVFQNIITKKIPTLFIAGTQTNINNFNRINPALIIRNFRNQPDRITPAINRNFRNFNLMQELQELIIDYPPIYAPYGNYELKGQADIVLFQKVGNIVTTRPFITIKEDEDQKFAVLTGEGFWQWPLQEYAKNQQQRGFDEIIQKLVQYLSSKEDRRKFRVYPVKNEFQENERVIFEAEMYNDIYERIYGFNVDLSLSSESGEIFEYNFVTSEANSRYGISGLNGGIYNYSATSNYNNQDHAVNGVFSVKPIQLENLKLMADHNLLKDISSRSGGEFLTSDEIDSGEQLFAEVKARTLISSSEDLLQIIHEKWIFFVLLGLATLEWFSRKYLGGY
ncbi:VWA domain-containing protein [Bacteroidota bacterium]